MKKRSNKFRTIMEKYDDILSKCFLTETFTLETSHYDYW